MALAILVTKPEYQAFATTIWSHFQLGTDRTCSSTRSVSFIVPKIALTNVQQQVLYESMLDLIKEWHISEEEKLKWLDAASRFRLPYWDWARKQTYVKNYGIPEICTRDTWDIVKPGTNGAKEAFNNPLTGFKNPKRGPDGERVPMGDPLMGKNAIPDDKSVPSEPLPVSIQTS